MRVTARMNDISRPLAGTVGGNNRCSLRADAHSSRRDLQPDCVRAAASADGACGMVPNADCWPPIVDCGFRWRAETLKANFSDACSKQLYSSERTALSLRGYQVCVLDPSNQLKTIANLYIGTSVGSIRRANIRRAKICGTEYTMDGSYLFIYGVFG